MAQSDPQPDHAAPPLITVVIPAHNAEEWIGRTLDSVLQQTYPRELVEIVVVDDGSTDLTSDVVRKKLESSGFAHSILRSAEPTGPGAARNRGWRHGRGEWIQFLDADDLLDPEKLEVQARLARYAAETVAVMFSRWTRLSLRNGTWVPEPADIDPSIGADPVVDILRADNFVATGSQLFRRTWLEQVGGYVESYRLIEDVDLLLRIAFSGGTLQQVFSARPLFLYRERPDSLSRSSDSAFVEGCVRNARTAERYCRQHDLLTAPRVNAIAGIYFRAARYFAEHDPVLFEALVSDLKRLEPRLMPEGPMALRMLTRVLGYPRAERCAVRYRRFKRSIRPRANA